MQEKMIIFLHANNLAHPSWATVGHDSTIFASGSHDDSEHLAEIATDKEIIVIVPAEDVLLTSVQLPKMNRSRLLQALPYALEEQLIDELESLHFAMGEYQAHGEIPVAVVSRKKMAEWLELLKSWKIQADCLVSAVLVLPVRQDEWQVLITDEMAWVRADAFHGFSCDKNNLATLLQHEIKNSEQKPLLIHVRNYTKESFSSALNALAQIEENFYPSEQRVADLARNAIPSQTINLLQRPYATKKYKSPYLKKIWQISAYLAAAWIFLLFFGPLISFFILETRASHIDAEIKQIYKKRFPTSASMVLPKLRMEEKLRNLSGQIGDSQLLRLLAYVGKGMAKTTGIQLQRFDFQNNQLTLAVMASSSDDITNFTDFLTQQGLTVKQQDATLVDSKIKATMILLSPLPFAGEG